MNFAIEVPAETVPLNLPDLCKALQAGTSQDHSQRQSASKQLETWQTDPAFYPSLQAIFLDRSSSSSSSSSSPTFPQPVRLLAIILLKNGIDKHWRTPNPKTSIPPEAKAQIRSNLFRSIDEPDKTLALQGALTTAKIVRIDYPREWPSALPDLVTLLKSTTQNASQLQGALLLVLRVVKELSTARLRRSQTALQHEAHGLCMVLVEVYAANVQIWLQALQSLASSSSTIDEQTVTYAMANSLTALKTLRRLMLSGFETPHREPLVRDFWTLSQTHFDQFLSYTTTNPNPLPSPLIDTLGKHLLQFTKLHITMSEDQPSSFAALPNAVALVQAYWGLVARFADEYAVSGGLRSEGGGGGAGGKDSKKLDGPLAEKLALKGLLLVKSCLQIVIQPLQTFKYKSPEAQKEQAEGVRLIKTELFVDAFLLQIVDVVVGKLFLFRQADLDAWEEDPEEWEAGESDVAGAAWEWSVRQCAERVFLSLLIHNKPLLVPPLLTYFERATRPDVDLLTKEAVYTAMGTAAAVLEKVFDFDAFLQNTLVRDMQQTETGAGSNAKILRRRIAALLGAWSFYELPSSSQVIVFTMFQTLLQSNNPSNDLVVRLTAARQLKRTVDDLQFRAALFEPFAADVFASLMQLLAEVDSDETKLVVLDTLRTFIERMETIASRFSDRVVTALPAVWASAAPDTYMIKQAVLTILSTLMMAVGPASQAYHGPVVVPLLAEAMDPAAAMHPYLYEEAVELWASVMNQSTQESMSDELVQLLPRILPLLEYESALLVQSSLHILHAYVVLAPAAVLQQEDTLRRPLLAAVSELVLSAKQWERVRDAVSVLHDVVTAASQLGGSQGVSAVLQDLVTIGFVPRMLEQLHVAWEAHQAAPGPKAPSNPLKTTTEVEYFVLLSRVAVAAPDVLVDMFSSVGGNQGLAGVWPWLGQEWFSVLDNMATPGHLKLACLGLTRLTELPLLQDYVLSHLQDYFGLWTSAILDAHGSHPTTEPDTYLWPDGAPPPTEYDTPLMRAEAVLGAQDPLHVQPTTYAFVVLRLQDLVARAGGEQVFEQQWAANVDADVLAGWRQLAE